MNMKPMKPMPGQQQPVKVDLSQAETLRCEDTNCNNVLFISSTIIKRLSPLVSPTGEEALVPIDVYSCGNCGKVPKTMLKGSGLEGQI
tara:strand:- start:907 stop:1170 length:264 start_codon:yes stop_codon:yes gene_type:complete